MSPGIGATGGGNLLGCFIRLVLNSNAYTPPMPNPVSRIRIPAFVGLRLLAIQFVLLLCMSTARATADDGGTPALGEPAPDFALSRIDDGATVMLSQYRGHRPVVLLFGSFT